MQVNRHVPRVRVAMVATGLALAGVASGCVMVVDGNGLDRGTVEWTSASASSAPVTARSATADGVLARDVQARFRIDSMIAAEDITVSSRGDTVTLHGRASNIDVLAHALRVAADTPGTARVVSRLTVEMEVL
jgi:osmotically-inducible protein OsmY